MDEVGDVPEPAAQQRASPAMDLCRRLDTVVRIGCGKRLHSMHSKSAIRVDGRIDRCDGIDDGHALCVSPGHPGDGLKCGDESGFGVGGGGELDLQCFCAGRCVNDFGRVRSCQGPSVRTMLSR